MATIDVKELHVNGGSAWQRAVQIWEEYVVDDTWTLTASCTYVDSNGCLKLVVNDGTDTTNYYLILMDALDGTVLATGWFTQPGWRYQPGVKLATYGARTTKTDFNDKMVALRRSMYGFFAGAASIGSSSNDDLSLPVLSANARIWKWIFKERMNVGIDWLVCEVYTPDTDYTWYGERGGNEGVLGDSVQITVAGGGGGAVDVSEIVEALQDIATRDVTFSVNNGAQTWSFSGRVRTD